MGFSWTFQLDPINCAIAWIALYMVRRTSSAAPLSPFVTSRLSQLLETSHGFRRHSARWLNNRWHLITSGLVDLLLTPFSLLESFVRPIQPASAFSSISEAECIDCLAYEKRVTELEESLRQISVSNKTFATDICRDFIDRNTQLDSELDYFKSESSKQLQFLHIAEDLQSRQRAEIRSLRDELDTHQRHESKFSKSVSLQGELDQWKLQNVNLKTGVLDQWNQTLRQKQRAVMAEGECERLSRKVVLVTRSEKELRQQLGAANVRLEHQAKRVDELREARIRLEAENREMKLHVDLLQMSGKGFMYH
ncbi:Uu.00g123210.m01.CDS01 [Anthostomella pinea]|uniref:Uu.00g123210.m01.CDS01 n=1 Tax=Anthostomella pinea TaxID=933095 RepID=A0AAI8VC30_9PEZI|nr:Uu.00g123210.m01.CDS01 [Anthostomella pinea]